MKRRRPQQDERRRNLTDLNLIAETKRQAVRRRGCASLLGSVLLFGSAAVSIALGLH